MEIYRKVLGCAGGKSSLDHLLHSDRDHWRFYNCDVLCHFKAGP